MKKISFKITCKGITLGILLLGNVVVASDHGDQQIVWKISIKGGGTVAYTSSDPYQTGILESSGKIKFNKTSILDLTFIPADSCTLSAVLKNSVDWTPYLDSNNHYKFGPIDSKHNITVLFSEVVPTGNYDVEFPEDPPDGLAPISDISGHYTGNTKHNRVYNLDAAADEDGKVMIVGTVTGIVSSETGTDLLLSASIKTVQNVPIVTSQGKFEGTFDGAASKANGSISAPAVLKEMGNSNMSNNKTAEQLGCEGELKYVVVKDDIKYKDKLVPIKKVASAEDVETITDGKKWSIKITISEETVQAGKKTKNVIFVSGVLTLPNNTLTFEKFSVKYSAKKGFSLKFKKGLNIDGQVDKKTKIFIKKMTMTRQEDDSWKISDGIIKYKIMRQKGQGSLADFVTD